MNCNCEATMKQPSSQREAAHPHDKIIRAWLDGETIEVESAAGGTWYPVGSVSERRSVPTFNRSLVYRIKPKTTTVTHKYRRYIARGSYTGRLSVRIFHYDDSGRVDGLVKWIDNDWVTETYEVEVES